MDEPAQPFHGLDQVENERRPQMQQAPARSFEIEGQRHRHGCEAQGGSLLDGVDLDQDVLLVGRGIGRDGAVEDRNLRLAARSSTDALLAPPSRPGAAQPGPPQTLDDAPDQRLVGNARQRGNDRQVRMGGVQSGQRIDLEELRLAAGILAQVDAAAIAAAERAPGRQRYRARLLRLFILGQAIDHAALAFLLVHIGIDAASACASERLP